MGSTGWLQRLRERGVIRVAASYAVIAWLLLQIADVTFGPLGVPRWVMVSLIVTAVLGFPVAVALAWFYEAGDRGVTLDTVAAGVPRPVVHGLRRYADIAVIAVLLAAVAVLLVRQSKLGDDSGSPAIAVLPFQNLGSAGDGEILASGIAESVLHQLASLAELNVISRTSSFAFRDRAEDARQIGHTLGARYLLEGSVQSEHARIRVTTQLIDTETGADVWSMRFDRAPGDVFEIQDEIAVQVTRALELSIDRDAMERMTRQGTTNLKAYLEYWQGRSLLAENRVVDAEQAIEHFEQAVKLDPGFATAYASLAESELFLAEFDVTEDRQARFERARARGLQLVDQALALDPENGDAWLQRAALEYYEDLSAAEADYRHGLELSPNSARGFAGLAMVLYETPARRDEALELLDRARKLDPLEPAYDVTKALFLHYERGDPDGAATLLAGVLDQHPQYLPALLRMCGLAPAQIAESTLYCEKALALDPLSEESRRFLVRHYLDLNDVAAAEEVARIAGHRSSELEALLAMHAGDWVRAGDLAFESIERRTVSPTILSLMLCAIRMHARVTGDAHRGRQVVESIAGVTWNAAGEPTLPGGSPVRDTVVTLADLMILDGDVERGRRLLAELVAAKNREVRDQGRSEYWYYRWHTVALALSGDDSAAIAMFERGVRQGFLCNDWWFFIDRDPALERLRKEPRFQQVVRQIRENTAEQRREIERMRREGLVPDRGAARTTPPST